jgi:integrase/recombinase XerC
MTGRSGLATCNRAMLDTGLRREEVASLTLDSLDRRNCLLTVVGKGDKERRVPYSTGVARLLDEWISRRGTEDGPPFWLTGAGIKMLFRRIQEDVGLERLHPHQLRHQATTMMARSNADLASVRRILGHTDISTTSRYLSMSDADLRAKHAVASPFESLALQPLHTPARRRRLSLGDD